MIAVFAYAFPHRKTQDFLCQLAACGQKEIVVLAAPHRDLENIDRNKYFKILFTPAETMHPRSLCDAFGFKYYEVDHSNVDEIRNITNQYGATLGIISGARILKYPVIELLAEGILNFHPGPLPETSGLDAFFYTVKMNTEPGVTAHFIDRRVDAGLFCSFHPVEVGPADTPETVLENIYQRQIESLRSFLRSQKNRYSDSHPIERPKKNSPMEPDEKREVLRRYPIWRAGIYMDQLFDKLTSAAESGDLNRVRYILDAHPSLIERRTREGWNVLIIAAFHQRVEVVAELLTRGADPNATGSKGTTVLMYAKTALMEQPEPDLTILKILIDNGADASRCDMYGRSVRSYARTNAKISEFFDQVGNS